MHIDEKLARGLANAETRMVKSAMSERMPSLRDPSHPIRAILKPVIWRNTTGRDIDPAYLRQIGRKVEGFFPESPSNLRLVKEFSEGDMAFRLRRIWLEPVNRDSDRLFQVRSLAVDIRPGYVLLTEINLFQITRHAVERFHLRTRRPLDRQGMRTIGVGVCERIGFASFQMPLVCNSAQRRMAWPFADGLALGTCEQVAHAESAIFSVKSAMGENPGRCDLKLWFARGGAGRHGGVEEYGPGLAFRIDTFIGPDELNSRQRRLRDGAEDIMDSERVMFEFMRKLITEPATATEDEFPDAGWRRTSSRLIQFLCDPENLIAMGNHDGLKVDIAEIGRWMAADEDDRYAAALSG